MSNGNQNLSLSETAKRFLSNLSPGEKGTTVQQEIYKFVRWFGWERPISGLTASEVGNYAEELSLSDTDYSKKIELIRAFLAHANKEKWTKINLAVHLKSKKGKTKLRPSFKWDLPEVFSLTQERYAELETELAALKNKRLQAIEEVRKAAADKDFRENAPLEAAREQRSYLEGQIIELEETLKSAIINEKQDEQQNEVFKVNIGSSVILRDLDSDEELRYTVVSSKEADPANGKISRVSPIGKAIIGKGQGEIVEVVTPAGKLHYQIKQGY